VRYLIRDRDGKFPELFDAILMDAGIKVTSADSSSVNRAPFRNAARAPTAVCSDVTGVSGRAIFEALVARVSRRSADSTPRTCRPGTVRELENRTPLPTSIRVIRPTSR
jgi:hypothetical protein